jgi:hypothetical protein
MNEQKYEVGDKVTCVNNDYTSYKLVIGETYTIKEIHYDKGALCGVYCYFILKESPFRYSPERFGNEFYFRRKKLAKIRQRIYDKRRQGILH